MLGKHRCERACDNISKAVGSSGADSHTLRFLMHRTTAAEMPSARPNAPSKIWQSPVRSANLAPWRSAHGGSDQLLRKWSKRRARRCSRLFRSSTTRRSDFKALFIVTNVIAWTYLLHAFYRKKGIDYRQFRPAGKRRRFLKRS